MKIKVDSKLLSEQIALCDACADNFTMPHLKDLFEGISNLLSEISFAVEENEEIEFERGNENDEEMS